QLPWWIWLLAVPPLLSFLLMLRQANPLHVVYDGGCGMCSHATAVMDGLDWAGQLQLHNLHAWPEVEKRFPHLEQAACIRDMHAVHEGERTRTDVGYDAYPRIAWRLPLCAPFAWLLYVPPVPQVGRKVYRRVADGRQTMCRIKT
ncbi:MAG: thiol-disulfide oxidoreductase DCC family protein, partial [Planctomycetota bacterium]